MEQGYIQHIVIGVGINVRKQEFPEEIRDRAAAIDEQCGFRISRSQLIADIMEAWKITRICLRTHDLKGLRACPAAELLVPAIFTDADGRMWMNYGSWSGGIFLLEIDPATGYPIYPVDDKDADPYYGYRLIGGGHHSAEGPYIQYDAENGYYYLFVSYGDLQSDGGYQIRQFRSEKPTGPYVDVAGNTLEDQDDHFNYGLKMMGNYTFPSLNYTYMAPGGQSTFQDDDGKYYITYHQRFDDGTEYHEPRVHQMYTNEDGWFVAAPFATMGETLSEKGYKKSDVSGTFYVVNHGTDISSKIREAEAYTFADGKVTGGEKSGTYEVKEGTDYITITLDGVVYKGVLMEMTDEAENPVLPYLICTAFIFLPPVFFSIRKRICLRFANLTADICSMVYYIKCTGYIRFFVPLFRESFSHCGKWCCNKPPILICVHLMYTRFMILCAIVKPLMICNVIFPVIILKCGLTARCHIGII